jgi:hypothetical protein
VLVKEYDSSKHSHDIAEAYHGVGHAEREMLDNIHPEDTTGSIAQTTAAKLPVGKQSSEIVPRKGKVTNFGQAILHEHLTAG